MLGGEAVGRWWEIPQVAVPDGEIIEQGSRAYAYLALSEKIAVAAELIDQRSMAKDFFADFDKWRTTSVPVTISYFSGSGLFASAGVEFVDNSFTKLGIEDGDTFYLLNATLGYRLPHNRGLFQLWL